MVSSCGNGALPSGKHTKNYLKWPFTVDLPMKNGGSFHSYVSLLEGIWETYGTYHEHTWNLGFEW